MIHPAFNAEIHFPGTGGVISSTETTRESYLHGNNILYRTIPKYKCEQLGTVAYYDFDSIVFKVINMGNACRLLVDKDESDQIIRIVV